MLLRRQPGMHMWLVRLVAKNNNSGFAPSSLMLPVLTFQLASSNADVPSERDGHPK